MMNHYPDYQVNSYDTLGELLESSCRDYADCPLFVTYNETITYAQFYTYVRRSINKLNFNRSSYYLLKAKRSELFAIAFFAVIISENIVCLHNSNQKQIEEAFEKVDFTGIISDDDIVSWISEETNGIDYDIMSCPSSRERCAAVLLSSGTTASPKGVCLSQKNLMSCTEAGMRKIHYPSGSRYVSVLPLYHVFGLVADLLATIYSGGTLCIPDHSYQLFSCLNFFKPDALHIPPIVADKLANLLQKSGDYQAVTGGALKKIMCAGAPTSVKTIETLMQYGIQVLCAYGLTECGACVSMNRDYDHKPGSGGLILDNNTVSISSEGEILVKGSGVMIGYLNDPELTEHVLRDGWLHTGDLGYIDEDGFLFITGRLRNLAVFSDGNKYIPEKLEEYLEKISGIIEVLAWQENNEWYISVCLTHTAYSDTELCVALKEKICSETLKLTKHTVGSLFFTEEFLPRTVTGKLVRAKPDNTPSAP